MSNSKRNKPEPESSRRSESGKSKKSNDPSGSLKVPILASIIVVVVLGGVVMLTLPDKEPTEPTALPTTEDSTPSESTATTAPDTGTAGTTTPSEPAAEAVSIPDDMRQQLLGQWVRTDGGYTIEIQFVKADGAAKAAYYNPSPINVDTAKVTMEEGKPVFFMRMDDVNYRGSSYALQYDPEKEQLMGVYYQAGTGQSYEVLFVRREAVQ